MRFAISVLLFLIGAVGIARVQPGLVRKTKLAKEKEDVVLLPPPDKLRAITLHYNAMVADFLWAKLLLEYGQHWADRRVFAHAPRYMDAILALDPKFRQVYEFSDSILVFRSGLVAGLDDAKLAREYYERGLEELPNDADLRLRYGQFLAFLGPSYVKDPAVLEEWRVTGARAIMRAVELGADADASLSAATILGKSGEREAMTQSLLRAYALASDEKTKSDILARLSHLKVDGDIDGMRRAYEAFKEYREERFPFLSVTQLQLAGPVRDPAECAGLAQSRTRACIGDWRRIMADRRKK